MSVYFTNKFDIDSKDKPYKSNFEYLQDLLKLLELQLFLLFKQSEEHSGQNPNKFKGIVLSKTDISNILGNSDSSDEEETDLILEAIDLGKNYIENRTLLTLKKEMFLPLEYVVAAFTLSEFEKLCILLSLSIEMDKKYESIYAYLQNDITSKYPTIDLCLKLYSQSQSNKFFVLSHLNKNSKLFRYFYPFDTLVNENTSLLSKKLILDDRLVSFILGAHSSNAQIESYAQIFFNVEELPPLLTDEDIQHKLKNLLDKKLKLTMNSNGKKNLIFIKGPSGCGKKLHIKYICKTFNVNCILVDLSSIYQKENFEDILRILSRESILQQAIICFYNFHEVISENEQENKKLYYFLDSFNSFSNTLFLTSHENWKPKKNLRTYEFFKIDFDYPDTLVRKEIWEKLSRDYPMDPSLDLNFIADKFIFTPNQIEKALMNSKNIAIWNHSKYITEEHLNEACYNQTCHNLEKKATLIKPIYSWNDIILPKEQIKELKDASNQVKFKHVVLNQWGFDSKLSYGKGLSIMFAGPPGTGKTMAAQVIAKEVNMEIYKIDLSQVVSKYIGETEKNLKEIFDEAKNSNTILFFDETDAILGKRSDVKDAHDRYSNLEVSFLLQKMEEHTGVTILATNHLQNIDEAFIRRINFIIHFPFPDEESRKKIWEKIFPDQTPLDDDIDFKYLAKNFEISGGNIKNIALSAAFLAASENTSVGMYQILSALKHELRKQGKILLREDFGEYYYYLE
ncbi:ATP-binding protein [Defluviitalea saccharophila]|uniref:ATP-binding protein n=1 Tax=Defluviitalea saccharophila TaxID=879970 RepID=A0ABZ2Y909_9FIRM